MIADASVKSAESPSTAVSIDSRLIRAVIEGYLSEAPSEITGRIRTAMRTEAGMDLALRSVFEACTLSALALTAPDLVYQAAVGDCLPLESDWARTMRSEIFEESIVDGVDGGTKLSALALKHRLSIGLERLNSTEFGAPTR